MADGLRVIPTHFVYAKGFTIEQVEHAIYDAARRGARVVTVDYLQCFRKDGGDRRVYLADYADRMKTAAARVGVHFILVSQVVRPKTESGKLPRPTMYQFKETGDIENMTEYALLPFRHQKGKATGIERARIYVDKAKDGPTGVIEAGWDVERHVFTMEPPDDAEHGQREMGEGGWEQG